VIEIARARMCQGAGRVAPLGRRWAGLRRVRTRSMGDITSEFYLRFMVVDRPGVLARIAGILGGQGISIASVIQKERKRGTTVPIVIRTHAALERDLRAALARIARLSVIKRKPVVLHIEEHLT
jgi:homoserine dehydrogenase